MKQKSWHLDRREFLRGTGIALALPFLESMMGSAKAADAGKALPKRMMISYFAYGAYMPDTLEGIPIAGKPHHEWNWFPCMDPGPLTFNKSAAPFAPLKEYISYLRGLDHVGGHGMGGHSSGDVFGTGALMASTEQTNNISIDQLAAKVIGQKTRFPSLVLGTEGGTGSYGNAKTLSHYGPGRPIPAMQKPQEIFNRMFQPYAGSSTEQVRTRLKRDASVLDVMLDNSKSLNSRLGKADQQKMDEYLDTVRALEQRVERSSQWTHEPLPNVDTKGLNLEVAYTEAQEYTRCLYDLIYLAFLTDSTRFATLMLESESSNSHPTMQYPSYVLPGCKASSHDFSHGRAPENGPWDKWRAEQHAYFLQRLRDTKEGDGNMLDRTLVLWGSAHSHAGHGTKNYPIHFAGGNALGFKHGNLHAFEGAKKKPLANLFVSMLNAVDAPTSKFADSTGEMTELRS
jgi:hypothetical protein